MTIWYVGGWSIGHALPLFFLAQQYGAVDSVWIGGSSRLDTQFALEYGPSSRNKNCFKKTYFLRCRGLVTATVYGYMACLFWLFVDILRVFYYAVMNRPDRIVTTGGGASLSVSIVARCMGIAIDAYELNSTAGKAILLAQQLGANMFVVYRHAENQLRARGTQVTRVSYPGRRYNTIDPVFRQLRHQQRTAIHADDSCVVLLVLGGSQGSAWINETIPSALIALKEIFGAQKNGAKKILIVHQAGPQAAFVAARYAAATIVAQVFDYADLDPWYAAADIIICRSGAGTLHEVGQLGVPIATIPLQTGAAAHQQENAISWAAECPAIRHVLYQDKAQSGDVTQWILSVVGTNIFV